jgi:hypothetical protein
MNAEFEAWFSQHVHSQFEDRGTPEMRTSSMLPSKA